MIKIIFILLLSLTASATYRVPDLLIRPKATGSRPVGAEGQFFTDSTTHRLQYKDNSAWYNLMGPATTDTLTGKTIDADGSGNSITNIENADIKAAAAIAVNKLAALTASKIVVTDSSGFLASSTATAAAAAFVDLTSSAQTQIDTVSAATLGGDLKNVGLAFSVGANALTIALKQADGSTNCAAGSGACKVSFRSTTATTASQTMRSVTGALSLVIPSGATLGWSSGSTCFGYVYLLDNAGTPELMVSSNWVDEQTIRGSTAISTSADDSDMYATSTRANVAIRMIGRFSYTTAPNGTYSALPDEVSIVTNPAAVRATHYTESKNSSITNFPATGTYGDATSLVLQPGEYYLTGHVGAFSATTGTFYTVGISTTSGNASTGLNSGENLVVEQTTNQDRFLVVSNYRVLPTTTTTYYLKIKADYSVGTPVYSYRLSAQRVR